MPDSIGRDPVPLHVKPAPPLTGVGGLEPGLGDTMTYDVATAARAQAELRTGWDPHPMRSCGHNLQLTNVFMPDTNKRATTIGNSSSFEVAAGMLDIISAAAA